MAKMTMSVELDRDELIKLITEYCLEKAGRPQGSSSTEFAIDQGGDVEGVVVTFNGVPKK